MQQSIAADYCLFISGQVILVTCHTCPLRFSSLPDALFGILRTPLMSAGIPVKLLNEAQGHVVSLELVTGDTYRGKLLENEDNMNLSLYDVVVTKGRTGATTHMNQVFVRGSMIRYISVPEILRNAPMFFMKPGDKPKPPVRGPPPKRARH